MSNHHATPTVQATALASAARTATTSTADITNHRGRGVIAWLNVTAVPSVETLTFTIQGKEPVSGAYYTILASTASATTGLVTLEVGPGTTAAANVRAAVQLPRVFRLTVTHSASGSFTYSVAYCLCP